jgi:hypothetical protein
MNRERRKVIENYISQVESVADEAGKLRLRVDRTYGEILWREIQTYRDLISIWRKRLQRQ